MVSMVKKETFVLKGPMGYMWGKRLRNGGHERNRCHEGHNAPYRAESAAYHTSALPLGRSGQGRRLLDAGPHPIPTCRGSLHNSHPETGEGTEETLPPTPRETEGGKTA